jgi:hypothetical protein
MVVRIGGRSSCGLVDHIDLALHKKYRIFGPELQTQLRSM